MFSSHETTETHTIIGLERIAENIGILVQAAVPAGKDLGRIKMFVSLFQIRH